MNQTDLIIERKPIAELVPASYNPRTISDEALSGLTASVERFGLVEPIVWNKRTGRVVGGHQRLKVLQKRGETETQVVVVDLEETEEKALNVALNNPQISGEFTPDLHLLLAEINEAMPELADQLRFGDLADQTKKLLAELAPEDGLTDPDDVPEPPDEPVTQEGYLIVLGNHRLICGDSGDPGVLARLMDGKKASLYATDPPYGVGYDGTSHPQNQRDKERGRTAGSQNRDWSGDYEDLDAWDHFGDQAEFEQFLARVFKAALPHCTPDAAWYCWHASATADSFKKAWKDTGVRYHQTITWVKPTHVLGFAMWNYSSEPCLMGWQQSHKPQAYQVQGESSNVWEVDWEGKARCTDGIHPTQKPVRLFELPMLKHTVPGSVCLETFAGSGSQLIAAERLGRRCFAVERNPRFCDVIVQRWEQFTGQQARYPEAQ
ncbi:MAG: DNA methyltransferase [Thermoanaerobaculales bacterium]|jgi:DNA modification methylase|nr:DNA methyltransferase [Thermoanaerobaculales bacterium]